MARTWAFFLMAWSSSSQIADAAFEAHPRVRLVGVLVRGLELQPLLVVVRQQRRELRIGRELSDECLRRDEAPGEGDIELAWNRLAHQGDGRSLGLAAAQRALRVHEARRHAIGELALLFGVAGEVHPAKLLDRRLGAFDWRIRERLPLPGKAEAVEDRPELIAPGSRNSMEKPTKFRGGIPLRQFIASSAMPSPRCTFRVKGAFEFSPVAWNLVFAIAGTTFGASQSYGRRGGILRTAAAVHRRRFSRGFEARPLPRHGTNSTFVPERTIPAKRSASQFVSRTQPCETV